MYNVIKRNGQEVEFNSSKITKAIEAANSEVDAIDKISTIDLYTIVKEVISSCKDLNRPVSVEEIQDFVEETLLDEGYIEIARKYIKYRYKRELARKKNTTDDSIISLLNQKNEELKEENSNKNATVISTQRDYMAGEVSKDIARRILLPEEVVRAHDEGIIHFHKLIVA